MCRLYWISYIPSFRIITWMIRKSSLKNKEFFSVRMSMWTERWVRHVSNYWSRSSRSLVSSTLKDISNYSWHRWWRCNYFTVFHIDCFTKILIELYILLIVCLHVSLIYCKKYYNYWQNNIWSILASFIQNKACIIL